jgi:hypothetical protein
MTGGWAGGGFSPCSDAGSGIVSNNFVVNAAEYYMMSRGVKIRLNMSPSNPIFTTGHFGVTDVLKKSINCSR